MTVTDAIHDPDLDRGAETMAQIIATYRGVSAAVDELEQLATA